MRARTKKAICEHVRAADYLSVAQIFLQDNFLLERPLRFDDIKPRLLGHWGTCHGINLTYAHLSAWIRRQGYGDNLFVLGPGHGFPALQANLFLEGTLGEFDKHATMDADGIAYICRNFSFPGGFPSHSSPLTPGVIAEGGELGYALSAAYGTAQDNPDLMVACLIGDGEAETASLLAALNLNKLISPVSNGLVLPILHLNGYKISGPTIFGRMNDQDLYDLLHGFGFTPLFVDEDRGDVDELMALALDSVAEIWRRIRRADVAGLTKHKKFDTMGATTQKEAAVVGGQNWFRMPLIVLRTAKGETGPRYLNGSKIAGNNLAHQVILTEAKKDPAQLKMLEGWLRSYRFGELFNRTKGFGGFLRETVPEGEARMGMNRHVLPKNAVKLVLPEISEAEAPQMVVPGAEHKSSAKAIGNYLRNVLVGSEGARGFRLFSPDETASNRLDAVYAATGRAWLLPPANWDKDMAPDGRIVELLSENTLQGLLTGYVLTGRYGVLASYEAFAQIVASQVDQHLKFLEQSRSVSWRKGIPALNIYLTSVGWRQDHNGFSHQNPGLISDLLLRPSCMANVFLPVDDTAALAAAEWTLGAKDVVNAVTFGKTEEPRWIDINHARYQLGEGQGASVCQFASDAKPDIIVAGAGDYVSKEALIAMQLVRSMTDKIKMRFVNIAVLSFGGIGTSKNQLGRERFDELFGKKQPVVCNFHGYPETMRAIFSHYLDDMSRLELRGYSEKGSTTTPLDMQILNGTDRYSLAIKICERAADLKVVSGKESAQFVQKMSRKLAEVRGYIYKYGDDPDEVKNWVWGWK